MARSVPNGFLLPHIMAQSRLDEKPGNYEYSQAAGGFATHFESTQTAKKNRCEEKFKAS